MRSAFKHSSFQLPDPHSVPLPQDSGVVNLCNEVSPEAPKRLALSSVKVKVEQATGQKSTSTKKKRESEPLALASQHAPTIFTKVILNKVSSSPAYDSHFGPHKHHQKDNASIWCMAICWAHSVAHKQGTHIAPDISLTGACVQARAGETAKEDVVRKRQKVGSSSTGHDCSDQNSQWCRASFPTGRLPCTNVQTVQNLLCVAVNGMMLYSCIASGPAVLCCSPV